jgi:hypothetical protein
MFEKLQARNKGKLEEFIVSVKINLKNYDFFSSSHHNKTKNGNPQEGGKKIFILI